jgi:hypothetical protein
MQRLVGLATLGLLLAGCSDGAADGTDGALDHGIDAEGNPLVPEMVTVTNGLPAPLHRVEWHNGSFLAHESCNLGGCLTTDGAGFRFIPIELPRDVPVMVGIDFEYETGAWNDIFGGFQAWLEGDATVYRYTTEETPGHVRVDATILPTGDHNVVLLANTPGGEVPETPYSLRISIDAHPQVVPPGVPVGVELGPGAEVRLAPATGNLATFLLYAPDDSLVGRYDGNAMIADGAPEGEYVILIPVGAPSANITTDGGAQTMKTLGLSYATGDVVVLPPHGEGDGELAAEGFPLAVGFLVQPSASNPFFGVVVSTEFSVSLTGPNGVELLLDGVCGLCITGGMEIYVLTESGDTRVQAGLYELHAETQATYEVQATPFAVHIQRFD